MGKPNIITTPSEDKMAIIPLAEYERLVASAEDATEVRAYDRVKRRLETGEDELLPAKFANRIIDGESAIRVWREYRGISAAELAKGAKIARPYLTQLETGKRAGTVNTISRIAGLLGVSVEDLFPPRR